MKYLVSPILLLLLCIAARSQYVSLNAKEIGRLKKIITTDEGAGKRYQYFEKLAEAALTQAPNPIDTIISEGRLATDPRKILTQKSLADMNKIYALAIVSRVTGKKIYAKRSIEYLRAWALLNRGVGNPINDTKLDALLEGYDLVKEQAGRSDRGVIETWLRQVAEAEINHPRFRSAAKSAANNWNSHRIKVVGNIAYLLNDKKYKAFTDSALAWQIEKNLNADGSGMDFEDRDALHYHIYTLEPLIAIATTIRRAGGKDFYSYTSPNGSSIAKSVAFLVPFSTGEKVHHEFTNSKTPFDRQRAANNEPGYAIGAAFKPQTSADVLTQAAYFEPQLQAIVKKLTMSENDYPNWRSVTNAASLERKQK